MDTTKQNPAQVHLDEMRDLAERILAMGNTLETRETGKPIVSVWALGAELAELVRHYDPREQQQFVAVVITEDSSEVDVFERESDAHAFATATGRYVFKDEPMWHAGAETTNAYIEEARS